MKPLWIAILALAAAPCFARDIDSISANDPFVPDREAVKHVLLFPPKLRALWLEALKRPEIDLQRQAAEAIAQAHKLGMTEYAEFVPVLVERLEAADASPIVRYAAARTLIVLEARDTAPILMKHAQNDGFDMAQLVEPALAKWKHEKMYPVWVARLENAKSPRAEVVRAIQAAGTAGVADAAPALSRLGLDRNTPTDIRVQAARALGVVRPQGLEKDARPLAAAKSPRVDRIVAASLLHRHQGAEAEEILTGLAKDPEPAVVTLALHRLVEIKPTRVQPIIATLAAHRDGGIRRLAVQAILALSPKTPALVDTLGGMLDDADVDVRVAAQETLIKLAETEALRARVLEAAMTMLGKDRPRGLEQAILVLGTLQHKLAAPRLMVLLDAKQHQVYVTAAWALRKLAVPETAEPITRRLKQETDNSRIPRPLTERVDFLEWTHKYERMQHLLEALGVMRHRGAEPLLREYLPKPPPPAVPPVEIRLDSVWQTPLRIASAWSLAQIHAGTPDAKLVATFTECMEDDMDPLAPMAAAALGHMKAKDAVPALRKLYKPGVSFGVGLAAGWAIHEITGEVIPPPKVTVKEIQRGGWFLEAIQR